MTSCWSLKEKIFQFQPDIKDELRQSEVLRSHLCDGAPPCQPISLLCPSGPVAFRCEMNEAIYHFNIHLEWEGLWGCTVLLKTCGGEVTGVQSLHPTSHLWHSQCPHKGAGVNIYIAVRAEVQGQLVFEHKHTMLNEFSQLPQQMEHMPLPLSYSCWQKLMFSQVAWPGTRSRFERLPGNKIPSCTHNA